MGDILYNLKDYSKPSWTPERTPKTDLKKLGGDLGLTYDYNSIKGKFDEVTKNQMALANKQQTASENKYYGDMYNTQMSSMDMIKKANNQAVATGASRGMQAANELSSVLGLQQESVAGATQLAADRSALIDKEREAYAQNALNALTQSNSTALQLGTLGNNMDATNTQFDVGKMDYYARLDAAMKGLMGAQEGANSNMHAAELNLQGMLAQAAASASGGGGYSSGSGGSGTSSENSSVDPFSLDPISFNAFLNNNNFSDAEKQYWKIQYTTKNPQPQTPVVKNGGGSGGGKSMVNESR